MLVMLQNSYLSVAQHPNYPDKLAVQSPIEGDIEQVFPAAQVAEDAKTGTYRAVVSKADMQAAMSDQVAKITYTSLSRAVRDSLRSAAYHHCAGTMKVMSGRKAAAAAKRPWPQTVKKKAATPPV